VNKSDLVARVSESLDEGRVAANRAVEAVIDAIQEAVSRGEKVAISGFGVFERVERAARTGRNPATGEPVQVEASAVPKFRPGAEFRGYVSGAREFVSTAVGTARSNAAKTVQAAAATIAPSRPSRTTSAPAKSAAPAKRAASAKNPTPAGSGKPAKKAAAKKAAPVKKAAAAKNAAPAKKAPARKAPAKRSS
jgi:DNA-binding protein HU-beta